MFLILYIRTRLSFLNETPTAESRKLHTEDVTRIGGIIFFSSLLILINVSDVYLRNILIYGFLFLILGLFEDVYRNISKYFRLLILFSICSLFVDLNDFSINNFDNYYLNLAFNSHDNIKILFSIFGILIMINGFNFIDGLNGLLLGFALIVLTTFAIYSMQNSSEITIVIYGILIPILILFIVNFFGGVILSGDGGSYYLGFILGSLSILISNYGIIDSFKIACIIFYPVMEFVCSVMRRLINFSNPLRPDGLHLHQLLFRVMLSKFENKLTLLTPKNINSLSSLIILISISILIAIHYRLSISLISDTVIFTVFCSLYLLAYNLLISYCHKRDLFKKNIR